MRTNMKIGEHSMPHQTKLAILALGRYQVKSMSAIGKMETQSEESCFYKLVWEKIGYLIQSSVDLP